MKIKVILLALIIFSLTSVFVFNSKEVFAAEGEVFTVEELSKFDGKDGRKAYTSYKGIVYDVTDSTLWKLGEHFGLNAGEDLTDRMEEAPHGDEVFVGFDVVGNLEGFDVVESDSTTNEADVVVQSIGSDEEKVWYEKRIRIAGFSILGWTGILLGIFFVLTFGTCFALPWAKLPLPWKGKKIGPDPLDDAGTHMTWSSIHKHFVWITVVFGIIHGIIGFLQMVGIYL